MANKGSLTPYKFDPSKFNHNLTIENEENKIFFGNDYQNDWYPFNYQDRYLFTNVTQKFKVLLIIFLVCNLIDIVVCIGMSYNKFKRSFLKSFKEI